MSAGPSLDARPSAFGVLERWLAVALLALLGVGLLSEATRPCGGEGLFSPVGYLGFILIACALGTALMSTIYPRSRLTGCLGLILALGVVLSLPDLIRTRISSNEYIVIADIRELLAAQKAYSKANGGYFEGRLSCLRRPSECIPAFPADQPAFLGDQADHRCGYLRTLSGGPSPSPMLPTISRTSVAAFAYSAVPEAPMKSGVRGWCADSTGLVCFTTDGTLPPLRPDGTCDIGRCVRLE